MSSYVEEFCKLFVFPGKRLESSFTFGRATGLEAPATEKTPRPGDREWGWIDAWFSEAGLLAATEDEGEFIEAGTMGRAKMR
ncbi:hypothetical protein BSZ32_13770 [Rubritalea profundi]|uniref:Uncharacterized protein n=1 Tax=Rubritalea profundi TaxID=1658618 RepID=A0A2S7U4E9_9BACT|nr:hypothetical protein BSZ32_13770 [Rubritalea profundi]